MVSGSISLPSPGSFSPFPHGTSALSVAVSYLALEGGPPSFKQDFSCPALLRCQPNGVLRMSHTGLSPSSVALPSGIPLYAAFVTPRRIVCSAQISPPTPHRQRHTAIAPIRFGLFPFRSPLLWESLTWFLLLQVLRWFSSPGVACVSYVFTHARAVFHRSGYPIRQSTDHRVFAPPRSFSQLTTAFFAGQLQGIRHRPLVA